MGDVWGFVRLKKKSRQSSYNKAFLAASTTSKNFAVYPQITYLIRNVTSMTWVCYVAQAGLTILCLLLQPPKCWGFQMCPTTSSLKKWVFRTKDSFFTDFVFLPEETTHTSSRSFPTPLIFLHTAVSSPLLHGLLRSGRHTPGLKASLCDSEQVAKPLWAYPFPGPMQKILPFKCHCLRGMTSEHPLSSGPGQFRSALFVLILRRYCFPDAILHKLV